MGCGGGRGGWIHVCVVNVYNRLFRPPTLHINESAE